VQAVTELCEQRVKRLVVGSIAAAKANGRSGPQVVAENVRGYNRAARQHCQVLLDLVQANRLRAKDKLALSVALQLAV
jgi:hypothetical protein